VNTSTNDLLKPTAWFAFCDRRPGGESSLSVAIKTGVALMIGGALLYLGHLAAGIIICGLALIIGSVSFFSMRGREAVSRFFRWLGQWAGRLLGAAMLGPLYLTVFTAARLWQRLCGADPLQLRDDGRESFWLQSDRRQRKRRYVHAMFATERLPAARRRLLPAAVGLLIVVLAAELILRAMGFGHPLLYINDPVVGYYPAANQDVARYGGRIVTNRFGMRSPDYPLKKPANTLRILMIGDSTLYGGSYMDQEALYSRLLEGHLGKWLEPHRGRVEVLSMGVNAWGPFHKLGYVKRYGTFDADVAVVCMPIGDIYRPYYGLTNVPFFSVDHPPSCALEEMAAHLVWRYKSIIAGRWTDEARQEQGRRGIEAYVDLARALKRGGCEVIFEILPSRAAGTSPQAPDEERQAVEQLRRALADAGFDNTGYPVGLFQDRGSVESLYHDGCHLYREGHRLYAEYLTRRLTQESLLCRHWASDTLQARRTETDREHLRR